MLLFLATVFVGFQLFFVVPPIVGGTMLDTQMTGDAACEVIAAMTTDQRRQHRQATLTWGMIFPMIYGALIIGTGRRFGGALKPWIIWVLARAVSRGSDAA